jgi:hypothetical protein
MPSLPPCPCLCLSRSPAYLQSACMSIKCEQVAKSDVVTSQNETRHWTLRLQVLYYMREMTGFPFGSAAGDIRKRTFRRYQVPSTSIVSLSYTLTLQNVPIALIACMNIFFRMYARVDCETTSRIQILYYTVPSRKWTMIVDATL